jgi:hypothetical protein
VLALVKSVPGNVSLESVLTEIRKLTAIRAAGLPPGLFADVAPKVVSGWRARAAVESPSHLRRRLPNSPQSAVTLLAALLAEREREVTDTLADLLIATVHRIGARAERKVTEELINAFRRVTGKENILFAIAEASLARPAGAVREVVFPAVRGGEQTLRELVHEYKTKGPVYRRTVQTTLKASYTNHYRRGLIDLLGVLEFRSTNTAHQPVIQALELITRYARAGNLTYYPAGETVPEHPGTTGEWADLVHRTDKQGRRRVVRMVYEVATFQALRERLRCKEIWVIGAGRWRDPDEDLPKDFEARRPEHYASLRKPLDPGEFTGALREEMTAALAGPDQALPDLDWVEIAERAAGAIRLTPLEAAPEPRNLRRVKNEVARRWAAVPLIDVLKETVLRTGCLQREIEEGLNVVESWNRANGVICYGRGQEISTNRREEAEMTALCLRILQASLVYVNTLMLQDVLADESWSGLLGEADRGGLTPLFWQHVRPHGEVRLDMTSRLALSTAAAPSGPPAGT